MCKTQCVITLLDILPPRTLFLGRIHERSHRWWWTEDGSSIRVLRHRETRGVEFMLTTCPVAPPHKCATLCTSVLLMAGKHWASVREADRSHAFTTALLNFQNKRVSQPHLSSAESLSREGALHGDNCPLSQKHTHHCPPSLPPPSPQCNALFLRSLVLGGQRWWPWEDKRDNGTAQQCLWFHRHCSCWSPSCGGWMEVSPTGTCVLILGLSSRWHCLGGYRNFRRCSLARGVIGVCFKGL